MEFSNRYLTEGKALNTENLITAKDAAKCKIDYSVPWAWRKPESQYFKPKPRLNPKNYISYF
jgi:hypothetical protein